MKKKILTFSNLILLIAISLSGIAQNRVWSYYGPLVSTCTNSGITTVENGDGTTVYRGGYCDNSVFVGQFNKNYTVNPTSLQDRITDMLYIGSNKLVVVGYGYSTSKQDIGFIFEMNMNNGTINWMKLSNNNSNQRVRYSSIMQGQNNKYVVTGTNHTTASNYSTDGLITIMDQTGNILNHRNYHSYGSDDFNGAVLDGNILYIASRVGSTSNSSKPALGSFDINFSTNSIVLNWSNFYLKSTITDNSRVYGMDVALNDDKLELLALGDKDDVNLNNRKTYLIQTDLNGTPLITTELKVPGYTHFRGLEIRKELDRVMILGTVQQGANIYLCIMYLSSNHSLLYGFKIINSGTTSQFAWNAEGQLAVQSGNQIYFSGEQIVGSNKEPIDVDIHFNTYTHTNTNCLTNYLVEITDLQNLYNTVAYDSVSQTIPLSSPNLSSTEIYYDVDNCNTGCGLEITSISATEITCDNIEFNASYTGGAGTPSYYWTASDGSQTLTSTSAIPSFIFSNECATYTVCLALTFDNGSSVCSDLFCVDYVFENCRTDCETSGGPGGLRKKSPIQNTIFSASIYPNPAKGIVNIKLDNLKEENATISIRTIEGKLVHKFSSTELNNQLNVSNFDSGVYLFEFEANGKIQRKKLIIQ